MHFLGTNGAMQFDDIYELYYYIFNEIGLGINQYQYLYDLDTGIVLRYKDKYIKATVQPVSIYPGKNDILFEPEKNYNLMVSLLGYYLDKESQNGNPYAVNFVAQFTERDSSEEKQRVVIRTKARDICSNFYYNIYLGYIECIFLLSDNLVDLKNFDQILYI